MSYLMENAEEITRLETKTDADVVISDARWAGLMPGMRVADIGCGPGKTTKILSEIAAPEGKVVGVDGSSERIEHAKKLYQNDRLQFYCNKIEDDLSYLGKFDFIWSRFFLEYFKDSSFDIVEKISKILEPGGIICLIDLDYNCMSHFDMPTPLRESLLRLINCMEKNFDFDPYVGRKLYSFLYDLGFKDISVKVEAHHLFYGKLDPIDSYNWAKKIEVATSKIDSNDLAYPGGADLFKKDFDNFLRNERRFSYTPKICVRGIKG